MSKTRYHSLDSLRGIASLQVVIGHCLVAIPAFGWTVYEMKGNPIHDLKFYLAYSPLHFFWSATPAVFLFFVLSGFVLSLPYYSSETNTNYLKFFVKRIIRLYLPCFIIIIISLLLKLLFYRQNALAAFDTWILDVWKKPINPQMLIKSFLLIENSFDGALWTLPIEIKLSLILPFFIYFHKRLNKYLSVLPVILFPVFYYFLNRTYIFKLWPDLWTIYYFTFFLIGSLICKHRHVIISWINSLPLFAFFFVLGVAVFTYTYQYSFWWLPEKYLLSLKKIEHYLYALSGGVFIIFALSDRIQVLLNSKFFLFIGKISFSIYLIHEVVVVTLAYILCNYLNIDTLISIGFITSVLLAIVFYKYIELPSSVLAKKVSDYVSTIFQPNKNMSYAKESA